MVRNGVYPLWILPWLQNSLRQRCHRYSPWARSSQQSPMIWPTVLPVGFGLDPKIANSLCPRPAHMLHTLAPALHKASPGHVLHAAPTQDQSHMLDLARSGSTGLMSLIPLIVHWQMEGCAYFVKVTKKVASFTASAVKSLLKTDRSAIFICRLISTVPHSAEYNGS